MREAAETVRADHAMARNHDRQPVVAARLTDVARVSPQLARDVAIGARLAAWDGAHRVPHRALKRRAFDHDWEIELGIRIRSITLKLSRHACHERVLRRFRWSGRRQIANLDHARLARRDADLHLREV